MQPKRVKPKAGQESVWDYPRPPRLEDCDKKIEIIFNGRKIATTTRAKRVLETSHPPVYYIPPEDIDSTSLRKANGASYCEWKGQGLYYDVVVGEKVAQRAAWYYPEPTARFASIKGYVAFYARPMDACYVDGEQVEAQPGRFYGGWITQDIAGPFKGEPGTMGW